MYVKRSQPTHTDLTPLIPHSYKKRGSSGDITGTTLKGMGMDVKPSD
jgi:hypothetical protein